MSIELARSSAPEGPPSLSTSAERSAMARAALAARPKSDALRGALMDALLAHAGESLAHPAGGVADSLLAEAAALLPKRLPAGGKWSGRAVMLQRANAALAQGRGRHADAVAAFTAALSHIPTDAGRDANAARLQLLVRLARSRLALGQAAETVAEMRDAETLMAALPDQIPARALDMVRAAVLGNLGVALAISGDVPAAETNFAASVALIDRLAAPEMGAFRQQILQAWAGSLERSGRADEATALRLRADESRLPAHAESCGCGHDHAHGHSHHHGHGHKHAHAQHDHHGADCGCGSHAH